MTRNPAIGVLTERRYTHQEQPGRLVECLSARGYRVTVIDSDSVASAVGDDRWLRRFDLVVARGRSLALLNLLARAEALDVPTLNRRAAIAAVHDKAYMAVALEGAKLPVPKTYVAPIRALSEQLPESAYPLILKPIFGDNGRGLRVVDSPTELLSLTWQEPVVLAQRFLCGLVDDVKLYGIGDRLWAVRKPSPIAHGNGKTRARSRAKQIPLTPQLREIGRRCRDLFGLDFYGVDCLPTPDGCVVIEVNDFPNYSGVPDAADHLADWTLRHCEKVRSAS